ncbi:MAG: cysteine synthase family protein [Candidatus Rokubacteria bacterium]|nr:cysteine synthase family protein [Candidatus Rokubacteria bacterium]
MTTPDWGRHQRTLGSLLEAIGCTPLVRLRRVVDGAAVELYGKVEWFSPTGSLKDRAYLRMIEEAEARGELTPGMTILECSTGNAGTACAFVAVLKGYPCIIVMPEGMSVERQKLIRAYGAELVLTAGGESDVDLALLRLEAIRRADPGRYWVPAQFDNPANIRAHYATTGPEIWEQMEGRIDAFVASQGTGGTITGVGRYLRERNPAVALFAVEPAECPFLSRRQWGSHGIEGIGDGLVPRNLDLGLLTGIITTTTEESVAMAKRLAREEGIFCGISSGCNVAAALKLTRRHPALRRVVVMINDTGQRYFTTPLCDVPKQWEAPEREHPMDAHSQAELDTYQPRWEIIA